MADTERGETSLYVMVFAALLVLTVVTVAVAYVDLHGANVAVALVVAGVKAALVAMVFMHARHSGGLVLATLLTGCLFVVILIGMTLAEYATRPWLPS